jgi:hypothetical protein
MTKQQILDAIKQIEAIKKAMDDDGITETRHPDGTLITRSKCITLIYDLEEMLKNR